jgi:hypothetical protein
MEASYFYSIHDVTFQIPGAVRASNLKYLQIFVVGSSWMLHRVKEDKNVLIFGPEEGSIPCSKTFSHLHGAKKTWQRI